MDGCADCGSIESPLLLVYETRYCFDCFAVRYPRAKGRRVGVETRCPECSAKARFGGRPLEGERASLYCHFCGVTFIVDAAGVPLAEGEGSAVAAVPANQLTLFGGT